MRAGRLRHKVTIYAPTSAVSALGEIETGETEVGTFYAEVIGRNASEFKDDDTLVSTTSYTIYLRYNSTDLTDVSPAGRLVVDGKDLRVLSVSMMDHRKRMIQITAEEAR